MKITTKTTKTDEVEIELPIFFKTNYSSIEQTYYAIFSEESGMTVRGGDLANVNCSYGRTIAEVTFNDDKTIITESEFTEAFETTMELIQSMIPVTRYFFHLK